MTSDPENRGATGDGGSHEPPDDLEVGGTAEEAPDEREELPVAAGRWPGGSEAFPGGRGGAPDDDLAPLGPPAEGAARRKILPQTTRASVIWVVVGFLVGVLVPAFALTAGTNAASDIVRDAVDSASPLTAERMDLEGEGSYLIVGERGTTGQCVVTGPDGSSLDIELEEVFQAGAGTDDVSLGSFAAGSAGRYTVDCDAGGADLALARSPALGGWSVLGGPLLVGAIGLVAGFAIGVIGLFGWIRARRNRWKRS